jgi:poly-gamma-glutamate capsule biosynthesis protein CapA/YwtB (metallophosphatase superfamily)
VSSRERQIRLLRGLLALALAASAAVLPRVDASKPPATTRAERAAPPAAPVAAIQATGRQPLAFVVHPTHAALDLSLADAYGLATGSIDRWRPLDGRSARVRLVLGPAAAARVAGLWLLLGKAPSGFHIAATEAAAAAAVALDPASLGLITGEGLSPAVRAVRLAGVDPLRAPARYPLAVPGGGAAPPVITAIAFGDVLTSRTVDRKMVAAGDFRSPWRAVGQALAEADLAFGNFEGTIAQNAQPRAGGTSFVSRVGVIEGFTFAGIDFLSLANNHVGDFGARTLIETRTLIRKAGIATAGAGADEAEAREPAILERHGVRFAFVSFNAIVGPPVATAEDPGAVWIHMAPWNPFRRSELDKVAATVREAKQKADVVIVYPHWGQEYTAKPNADQVRVAHALIDAGADMIIATHPHWVQGAEIYKGRLIAYSLGNFVFDQTWSTETEQGAALELVFWGPRLVGASFVPVQIEDAHRPRFLDDRAGAEILNRIWGASGEPYRRGL